MSAAAALNIRAEPYADEGRAYTLSFLIARIDEAVELETRSLKSDRSFDVAAANARKGRFLYDLIRAVKSIGQHELTPEHHAALRRLRATLARNEATIKAHLEAVNEVATLMRDAIRGAETDGTYSANAFGYGE